MNAPTATLIAALHRELGIEPDYAKQRGLPLHAEACAAELVTIAHKPDGSAIQLVIPAAAGWAQMQTAAHGDGITLLALSGFRSVQRQVELVSQKLARGHTIADILKVMAAPGHSEHHTGRALDIGTPHDPPLEESFALTAAYGWLQHNASRFQFQLSYPRGNSHGFVFEPWHWCWSPQAGST